MSQCKCRKRGCIQHKPVSRSAAAPQPTLPPTHPVLALQALSSRLRGSARLSRCRRSGRSRCVGQPAPVLAASCAAVCTCLLSQTPPSTLHRSQDLILPVVPEPGCCFTSLRLCRPRPRTRWSGCCAPRPSEAAAQLAHAALKLGRAQPACRPPYTAQQHSWHMLLRSSAPALCRPPNFPPPYVCLSMSRLILPPCTLRRFRI